MWQNQKFLFVESILFLQRKTKTKEVKLVPFLGFWCFPLGFATTKEGWLAVALLGGLLQSGQQNRATATNNKPPICL